ncbi:MAG: sensor histidine kinase [Synechococcaceae cyanobacterium]
MPCTTACVVSGSGCSSASRTAPAGSRGAMAGGGGFPPELLPQLFQRFGQRGSGTPGAGLGLYLCRLISEAHGGRIQASNLSGGGARVVVELPQQGA